MGWVRTTLVPPKTYYKEGFNLSPCPIWYANYDRLDNHGGKLK